jgi:dienelactone hydrolase
MIWMHGRTASKELDPGRYARWLRAGIATCAIDLPGHGERADQRPADPANSIALMREALSEIDSVVADLIARPPFDRQRLGVGGMSLGGMVALRRLCETHPFRCGAVEATTGDLQALYAPGATGHAWTARHTPENIAQVDAASHLEHWRPIPLLVVHSRADEIVPWETQAGFVDRLREHYLAGGADPELVAVQTWESTGAPSEHIGFGRLSHDAKTLQTEFLSRCLGSTFGPQIAAQGE